MRRAVVSRGDGASLRVDPSKTGSRRCGRVPAVGTDISGRIKKQHPGTIVERYVKRKTVTRQCSKNGAYIADAPFLYSSIIALVDFARWLRAGQGWSLAAEQKPGFRQVLQQQNQLTWRNGATERKDSQYGKSTNKEPIHHRPHNKYIPVVKTATGEIQLSARFRSAEQTAIARILTDTDTEFIAGDSCPECSDGKKKVIIN